MVPSMAIHLDLPSPAGSCGPPETPGWSNLDAMSSVFPIRPCSRRGLPCHPRYRARGGLLPHRFTIACAGRLSVLCGAFPRVSPAGRYPAPSLLGVRTFLTALARMPGRCGHPAICFPTPRFRPIPGQSISPRSSEQDLSSRRYRPRPAQLHSALRNSWKPSESASGMP